MSSWGLCSPVRQLSWRCPGPRGCGRVLLFQNRAEPGRAGAGLHSLALSPSSCPLLLPPTDAAAGEWASTLRGGETRWAGPLSSPPRGVSAPRTPPPALRSPARGERWLSWDCVPFGSSCSCFFLPPHPRQESRWLGLLSPCRTHRTTLSVSPACVNGALSGWLEQPSWRHEWGTQDGGGNFLPDPTACSLCKAGSGAGAFGPQL